MRVYGDRPFEARWSKAALLIADRVEDRSKLCGEAFCVIAETRATVWVPIAAVSHATLHGPPLVFRRAREVRDPWIRRTPRERGNAGEPHSAGAASGEGLPGPLRRTNPTDGSREVDLSHRGAGEGTGLLGMERVPEA